MGAAAGRTALGYAVASGLLCCRPAFAQQLPTIFSDTPSAREEFLGAAIAAMMLCGLASFLLLGRISARVHVALALLGLLIGGFALLVLFGGYFYASSIGTVLGLALLIGMFKLMSLMEGTRRPGGKQSKG
jgi:hypothetical protein